MNQLSFGVLTRRATLTALGATGLAAMASPLLSDAKKRNRKKKKKFDVNKLCKKQVGQCEAAAVLDCADDPECIAATNLCCKKLATCDFAGLFACLEEISPTEAARHFGG